MATLAVHVVVLLYLISVSGICTMGCVITPGHHQEVEPGQTLILSCTVSMDQSTDKLVWLKNGHVLSNVSIDKVDKHGSIATLQLSNVSSKDSGEYQCKATIDRTDVKCSTMIDVFARPRISSSVSSSLEVYERGNQYWCCSAFGYPQPQLTWFFKNMEIVRGEIAGYVLENKGECLRMINIVFAMEGIYSCVANNSRGQDKFDISLNVIDSFPIVKATSKWYVAQPNQTIVLQCSVSDYSQQYPIAWYHQHQLLINHNEEYLAANNTTISYLTITNTTTTDAGPYKCKVQFYGKSYDDRMVLIVVDEGLPSVTLDQYEVSAALGAKLSLMCTARYPKFAENVEYKWIKNGSVVSSSSRTRVFYNRINGPSSVPSYGLTITHFTRHDVGNYTCVVISILRNISTSTYISLSSQSERIQRVKVKTARLSTLEVTVIVLTSCSSLGIGLVAIVCWYLRRKKPCSHPKVLWK